MTLSAQIAVLVVSFYPNSGHVLAASSPLRRHMFYPTSGHVGFMVDKVAVPKNFVLITRSPLTILVPPTAPSSSSPSRVRTVGPLVADVPSGFTLISPMNNNKKTKLHGLSLQANYTDLATAACRRSDCQLLRIEGATWSA
jgi:hypothetical protein